MAWQENHDIQYVLEVYSYVMYICDYMTKAQKGMSTLMAEACKEAENNSMTLKHGFHHMAKKLLIAVESSVMEVCYDILQLPITQSSIKKNLS